jgi:hypothetical protein
MIQSLSRQVNDRPQWRSWFDGKRPIKVIHELTPGFEYNRRKAEESPDGFDVGLAHDGFHPSEKVQVLLPLERIYLHVVVSRDFYDKMSP